MRPKIAKLYSNPKKQKLTELQQIRRSGDGFIEMPLRNTRCIEER